MSFGLRQPAAFPGFDRLAGRAVDQFDQLAPVALELLVADPGNVAERFRRSRTGGRDALDRGIVQHDSTIDGIAAARPQTLEQLRGIPGIGDKKLERYGRELIELVNGTAS